MNDWHREVLEWADSHDEYGEPLIDGCIDVPLINSMEVLGTGEIAVDIASEDHYGLFVALESNDIPLPKDYHDQAAERSKHEFLSHVVPDADTAIAFIVGYLDVAGVEDGCAACDVVMVH